MILVDTSIWVNHFHEPNSQLQNLLYELNVTCHPFIVGELACGNIQNRAEILTLLQGLPTENVVSNQELLFFIETHRLMGRGIGFVDIHLLAAVKLMGHRLWSADKRLNSIATEMGLAFQNSSP